MNRRGFLGALFGGLALDPERALWIPGRKLISIPKPRFVGKTERQWLASRLSDSMRFTNLGYKFASDEIVPCQIVGPEDVPAIFTPAMVTQAYKDVNAMLDRWNAIGWHDQVH